MLLRITTLAARTATPPGQSIVLASMVTGEVIVHEPL
jgi:hypothetical protein